MHTFTLHQGFVRLAAETGAQIVPVISFGENDLFTAEPVKADTPFGKFQRCVRAAQADACTLQASHNTGARVEQCGQARVLVIISWNGSYWAVPHKAMVTTEGSRCVTMVALLPGQHRWPAQLMLQHRCRQVGLEERRHHGAQLLVGGAAPGSRQHGLRGAHQGESPPSAWRATHQGKQLAAVSTMLLCSGQPSITSMG